MISPRRLMGTIAAIRRESSAAVRISGGRRDALRLIIDVVLYRVLAVAHLGRENSPRSFQLHTGRELTYRLNRGDIQSIREVLFDEAYRLPFSLVPSVIVDLGANIGLTSLYLASRYRPQVIVAVEAAAENAELARRNLGGLPATVVEAAIGPRDGTARFATTRDSNLGSVTATEDVGREVPMMSMQTLLSAHSIATVDLLKLDIEGGEEALLLDGDTSWLSNVRSIIAEFHPDVVDYQRLITHLVEEGFRYVPAGSAWPGSMDAFVRDSWPWG